MPMGCENGNVSFQRMLEDILKPVADCADPFVDNAWKCIPACGDIPGLELPPTPSLSVGDREAP